MSRYSQYVCDGCGREDRPVLIEVGTTPVVPLPEGWEMHSIDGQPVHLCPDCAKSFENWSHTFFECDQV